MVIVAGRDAVVFGGVGNWALGAIGMQHWGEKNYSVGTLQVIAMYNFESTPGAYKETWVHPDADFTQFSKIFLWEGELQYRDVDPARRTRSTMMSTRKREFGISDADRQKFEQVVSDAFDQEIQKSKKFTIVDELGPNTMILRGAAAKLRSELDKAIASN